MKRNRLKFFTALAGLGLICGSLFSCSRDKAPLAPSAGRGFVHGGYPGDSSGRSPDPRSDSRIRAALIRAGILQ